MSTTVEEAIRKAVSVGTFGRFIVSEENFAYETLEGEITLHYHYITITITLPYIDHMTVAYHVLTQSENS